MDLVITPDGFARVFFVGYPCLYICCIDMKGKPVREMVITPYRPHADVERSIEDFHPLILLLTERGSNGEEWLW